MVSEGGHDWQEHEREGWAVCRRCGLIRNYSNETACRGALPKIRQRLEDCGQDGVCATPPGCLRHWEERCRELVAERDAALAKAEAYERDWREAKSEFGTATGKLREALRQETRVALDYQTQRDEWKRQCDIASEAQADALNDAAKARSELDALRVELLETQHEIGEAWFKGGCDTPAALRRKQAALERLGTAPMRGAKLISHLLRRVGALRAALKAAASSIETIAEGRVDADALPHQQDIFQTRAYAANRASVARKALLEDDTDAMPDAARFEALRLAHWIRLGGPCVDGDTIYGPYQDACDMIAHAIERGETELPIRAPGDGSKDTDPSAGQRLGTDRGQP